MRTDVMPPRLDQSALHLLHRAGQQAELLFLREVADAELTPRQFAVLAAVEHNEDISQTGLVAATGIDRSTLADVVRRLVTKGLLQRKRSRQDQRRYAVRLTARGRDVLLAARPGARRADEKVLAQLAGRQRGDFLEALARVVRGLEQLSGAA